MDQEDDEPDRIGSERLHPVEREIVAAVSDLIEAGRGEEALDLFLAETPRLLALPFNRREKLNTLSYLGRWLQESTGSKHGPDKLHRKRRKIERYLRPHGLRGEGAFLDLGCGDHDPIALSTLCYLNGFDRAIACDLRGPRNPRYSAMAMLDVIAHLRLFSRRYRFADADHKLYRTRLAEIDAAPFAHGDFAAGLASLKGKIDAWIGDVVDADVAEGELGLAVSIAVLEHVTDLDGVLAWLYRRTRPGGLHLHAIDMADHRGYARDGRFDAWSFLTEEEGPSGMNRLRKSEHLAAIRRAGFDILVEEGKRKEIPPATFAAILPRFREMPEGDLTTTQLNVVLRRPEAA